jgi:hypothetical protein
MPKSHARQKRKAPKRVLALPDLEQAKSAVLDSLSSLSGQRTYDHAITEFVGWYCSEPRLAFNRTVVLRYRIHLEQQQYAPATINLRLAAVRRVAYEAADAGLLSPELAAGIRRVKGVRRLGVRMGNWLTPDQGRRLLHYDRPATLRTVRNHAMLAMLIGCGLRRGELLALTLDTLQQREDHWVIVNLAGKGGHVRTVPVPSWVKDAVDAWTAAAGIAQGRVFLAINKAGQVWGDGMTPKGVGEGYSDGRRLPLALENSTKRLCNGLGNVVRNTTPQSASNSRTEEQPTSIYCNNPSSAVIGLRCLLPLMPESGLRFSLTGGGTHGRRRPDL